MVIYTIALAPLGCGNGGLTWAVMPPLMRFYLADIPDLEVFAYRPMETGVMATKENKQDDGNFSLVAEERAAIHSLIDS